MDENTSRQILDDLLPSLEALDTKASALLQLLKDKGIATPEEITAHLDQAANGSNVRWRAARVRLEYLLSSAAKPQDEAAEKKVQKKEEATEKKSTEPVDTSEPASQATKEGEAKENQKKKNPETSGAKAPSAEESADTKQSSGTQQDKGNQQPKENPTPAPSAEKEAKKQKDNTNNEPGDPANKAA